MNLGTQPISPLFPPGTAGVDADERAHLLSLYSGVPLASVTPPAFSGTIADISVTYQTGTHAYDFSTYFTGATSYSISPAVEDGWSFNTSTAELVIDTDDPDAFGPFTITGTNLGGSADSNSFNVTVAEIWDDASTNSATWYVKNPTETIWDGDATFWDQNGNVLTTLWDNIDDTWTDEPGNPVTWN